MQQHFKMEVYKQEPLCSVAPFRLGFGGFFVPFWLQIALKETKNKSCSKILLKKYFSVKTHKKAHEHDSMVGLTYSQVK